MNCVIVGLDDSAASRAALRWAAVYAAATQTDLCAVHILDWPVGLTGASVTAGTRLHVPRHEVAAAYWRGIHRVFRDVDCPPGSTVQFAQGDVGDVLVRFSEVASLLIIGTREPIRARPYPAGSISHYCISQVRCPVVTVPEPLPDAIGTGGYTTPSEPPSSELPLHDREHQFEREDAAWVRQFEKTARRPAGGG